MLEHEEGDETSQEEHEQGDVGVDGVPVQQELLGVLQEDALHLDLIRVEEEHAQAEDGQQEADDGNRDFPSGGVAEVTALHVTYAEEATRMMTPSAIRQMAAAMGAILGTSLGAMWAAAIHNSPSPSAVTITIQKALRKP